MERISSDPVTRLTGPWPVKVAPTATSAVASTPNAAPAAPRLKAISTRTGEIRNSNG